MRPEGIAFLGGVKRSSETFQQIVMMPAKTASGTLIAEMRRQERFWQTFPPPLTIFRNPNRLAREQVTSLMPEIGRLWILRARQRTECFAIRKTVGSAGYFRVCTKLMTV